MFAETKDPPGKIFFSGSLIADEALQVESQKNHKETRFASFLDSTTPPLYLGSIDDMREAGFNNYFISMLIKPDKYAGDDKDGILRIKVFYSLLVKQSPSFEKLRSFEGKMHSSYSKNEIKSALDDLLLSASALEKTSLVELLLSRGANPNARS